MDKVKTLGPVYEAKGHHKALLRQLHTYGLPTTTKPWRLAGGPGDETTIHQGWMDFSTSETDSIESRYTAT